MRHKGLSFHRHALSFITSTKETTQQTPGGQEEGSSDETRAAANTEVLRKLQERAEETKTAILAIIGSAESLLAYINGPASNAKTCGLQSTGEDASLMLTHHHPTNCDGAPAD